MSTQRFRAEKDYFGKRSRLPEELIGRTAVTGGHHDAALEAGDHHDAAGEDADRTSPKTHRHTYLAFGLRGQGYVLETPKVKEIIRQMKITPIPRTPGYVKGVINLRDGVIPVVDLGCKLGMEETEFTEQTCIIVVEVTGSKGPMPAGIIVDSVSEVITIPADQIQTTPVLDVSSDTASISGMVMLDEGVTMVVDIDSVLGEL